MKPPFDFNDHFNGRSMKAAVFLCGSTVGSLLFGMDIGGIATLIDQGLSHLMPYVPFMDTGSVINSYFTGIQSWVGGAAMGLFDWAKEAGSDAVQAASHGILDVRNVLGPRAGALREFFTETLRGSMDAGAVYLSSVRDSISRDPAGVATVVGEALTKAVEVFGVVKGLYEAYKYAKGKVLGGHTPEPAPDVTGGSADEKADASVNQGCCQNVTNIHLNIALGNARDVGEAVEGLVRSVRNSANPEIITDHLVRTLAPHAPLTADSPVAGSDIRPPKKVEASNDNLLDMLEDRDDFDALHDEHAGAPLISSEDVIWCSDEFCKGLEQGVRRNLGGKLNPTQLNETIEGLSRSRKPLASIEGGIILRATPRGELTTTPVTPRHDHGSGLLIQ